MPADQGSPSVLELAELTELRHAEAEAVWLRLCADYLQDPECNRAADTARAAIAAQPINTRAQLRQLLELPEPTFKFPKGFGFRGVVPAWRVAAFLRLALFPAALEKVARDAYGGLEERRASTLRAEKELERAVPPIDPQLPEGISDEQLRHEEDFGIFEENGPSDSPGLDDELVAVPELHRRALAEMTRLFQRLAATGRFTSKKLRKEMWNAHRSLRRLVEHAYPVESDQDRMTQRVHQGCVRALEYLARFGARRRTPLAPAREMDVLARILTGKITELAELVKLRRESDDVRRNKRVSKALDRP